MANLIKKPRAGRAPDIRRTDSIDNLLRKLQLGLGYDPLVELVALARDKKSTNKEKITIASELMSYVYPKVKATATDPNMGDVINITVAYADDAPAKELEADLPSPMSSDEIAEITGLREIASSSV